MDDVPGLAWTRRDGVALRRLTQGSGPGVVLPPPHGRGPGDLDALAPPENGRSLLWDFPDRVTLLELPDAGHRMAQECPGPVARAIRSWLRNLGP